MWSTPKQLEPRNIAENILDHLYKIIASMHEKADDEDQVKRLTKAMLEYCPCHNPMQAAIYLTAKGTPMSNEEAEYRIKELKGKGVFNNKFPREPEAYLADMLIFVKGRLDHLIRSGAVVKGAPTERKSAATPVADGLISDFSELCDSILKAISVKYQDSGKWIDLCQVIVENQAAVHSAIGLADGKIDSKLKQVQADAETLKTALKDLTASEQGALILATAKLYKKYCSRDLKSVPARPK